MGYSGAGLGFGLQQGFAGLGSTLMGISDRKREREAREQAVKMHQMERREDQTYQRTRDSMADKRYADQQARIDEATANAETIRRGEALSGAMETANKYMAGGQQATINPGKVYFTGSPLDGTLQQNQTLQAESGIPTVQAGAYDPKQDIGLQRSQALAKTYIDMGAGPKGQITKVTPEDDPSVERRGGWVSKLGKPLTQGQQDVLDALAQGQMPEQLIGALPGLVQSGAYSPEEAADIKKYLSGGSGGMAISDFNR